MGGIKRQRREEKDVSVEAGAFRALIDDPDGLLIGETSPFRALTSTNATDRDTTPDVRVRRRGAVLELEPARGRATQHGTLDDLHIALLSVLNRQSLHQEPRRLHLHCATASREGRSVLICGPSESGKTTTLLALLTGGGWSYQSDEMAAFDRDPSVAHTWPKPLAIRSGTRQILPESILSEVRAQHHNSATSWPVAPRELGIGSVVCSRPSLLVFLTGQQTSGNEWSELDAAEATVRLVGNTMDFERFGGSALLTLARLAASCPAIELPRSDPSAMAATIAQLAERPFDRRRPSTASVELGTGHRMYRNTEMVAIGTTAVLRNTRTGTVGALNAKAAQVITAHVNLSESGPTPPFLHELAQAGLIEPETP